MDTVSGSSSADVSGLLARARGLARLAGLGIWTGVGIVICGGSQLCIPFPGVARRVRRWVVQTWGRGVLRLLGIRVTIDGPVPREPYLLVSNHLSYVDIPVLMATTPCRFVAKQEVRRWPGFGLAAAIGGTIFIDRASVRDAARVSEGLGTALAQGDGIVVFAEATSSPGREVLPFRPALLDWAARHDQPVHFATVGYETGNGAPPAHLAVCWWGDMTFGDHLAALARLRAFRARLHFGPAPLSGRDRKDLAQRLHQAVSAQFVPVVTQE